MRTINLGKMCIHFPELLLLKRNENVVFISKTTQNKVKGLFFFLRSTLFVMLCLVVVLHFLNKTLGQEYSDK